MRACFNRAPVVARSEGDRVDAVEDAFVVSRGAIGVGDGKGVGVGDVFDHGCTVDGLRVETGCGNGDFGPRPPLVRQVAEDAKEGAVRRSTPPAEARYGFRRGVDGVGPHCIPRIKEQMDNEHGRSGRFR